MISADLKVKEQEDDHSGKRNNNIYSDSATEGNLHKRFFPFTFPTRHHLKGPGRPPSNDEMHLAS